MLLSRAAILEVEDLEFEEIEIPEWGGTIRIRVATAAERARFVMDLNRAESESDADLKGLRFLTRVIVDERNERVFEDKDAEELGRKHYKAIDQVSAVAFRLAGLSMDENAIEEAEKNSSTALN